MAIHASFVCFKLFQCIVVKCSQIKGTIGKYVEQTGSFSRKQKKQNVQTDEIHTRVAGEKKANAVNEMLKNGTRLNK